MKVFKIFIICCIIIFAASCFAQTDGIIKGKVVDSRDSSPLENASVKILLQGDSSITAGTGTDKSGNFLITKIPFGKYKVEISFIGYNSNISNISIDKSSSEIDLGTIKLAMKSDTTGNIEVVSEKPIMTFEGDKKVFDVSNTSLFKGGSVLDILRKTPLVDVDANDNIMMRGSQNVVIMIDGKPNKLMNLKQLPSEMVEKVEVITNPPAKYEAEGITGIINIVLKKSDEAGYQGNVNLSIGNQDKYNGGIYFNYKKERFSLFSGAYIGKFHNLFNNNSTINYYSPSVYNLLINGNSDNTNKYLSVPLGVEYELFEKHNVGLEGFVSIGNFIGSNFTKYLYENSQVVNPYSYYTRGTNSDGNFNFSSGTIYYNGKPNNKGDEISGEVTFFYNKVDFVNNFNRKYFDVNGNIIDPNYPRQTDNSKNISNTLSAQLDYTNKVTDNIKIETGGKYIYRKNDNDFLSDSLNYSKGYFERNYGVTNHFILTENISALYAIASTTLEGITFKFGIRAENTHSLGEQIIGNQNFTKDYTDFFPSFSISKTFGQTSQLQLSYSRRVTRPSIWRLNPFINRSDPNFVYFGNPLLNPEYTNSYETSFMLFTPYGTITPLAFYRRTTDVISSYSYLDSGVTYTTYKNASAFNSYGVDLILNSSVLKWFNFSSTLSFYDTKFDSDAVTDYNTEEGFSWKANIRTTFIITDYFNFEISYNYTGKKVNAQGYSKPTSSLDMSISRNFFNDKLTISFRGMNILKTTDYGQNISTTGYSSTSSFQPDSQMLFLSFSYKFGNTTKYIMKSKKTKQNQNEGQDQQQDNSR